MQRLRRNALGTRYGLTDELLGQIEADTLAMEKVAQEQAARKMMLAGLNASADELLMTIDTAGRKALFIPRMKLLETKGN